jgi:hypothetical protein
MTRLGPKTAAKIKKPPTRTAPTHRDAKASTSDRQTRREEAMTRGLDGIKRGKPAQGQPARPTPKVNKKGC